MPVKKKKKQWKESSNPLKYKGFQLVCVTGNGNVLEPKSCRKQKETNSKRVAGNGVLVG